jgi:hypothetical protein
VKLETFMSTSGSAYCELGKKRRKQERNRDRGREMKETRSANRVVLVSVYTQ